jgi:multidrug efflux pump subunit AcrB
LSFDDVAKAVASANVLRAVGGLEDHYKLFLVVSNDILDGVDPIRHNIVKTLPDGVVTIDDVAKVRRSTAPQWIRVTADGQDAVLINVYQQPGGNRYKLHATSRHGWTKSTPSCRPGFPSQAGMIRAGW